MKAQAVRDERVPETVRANPLDKFSLGGRDQISDLMIVRMSENDELVKRYLEEPEFQNLAYGVLAEEVFKAVRGGEVGVAGG